jgi:SAM-dependent methyltransferase
MRRFRHAATLVKEEIVSDSDKRFAGSIPRLYETHLVPLIFAVYAKDLADRLRTGTPSRVLEVACGTGVVTRALAAALPANASIIATDLNQAMLDHARTLGPPGIEWRQADALQLPFGDGEFDAVVCQFGVMFFPDKPKAFSEARRVLRPGGVFLFNVWDRIEDNEFADVVTTALASVFPEDPPRFMARIPHGYHDVALIAQHLRDGGFKSAPTVVTLAARSRARSPDIPAIAYCQGTPLRNEIEARDPTRLEEATDAAAQAISRRFGSDSVDGKIQAHIIRVDR